MGNALQITAHHEKSWETSKRKKENCAEVGLGNGRDGMGETRTLT